MSYCHSTIYSLYQKYLKSFLSYFVKLFYCLRHIFLLLHITWHKCLLTLSLHLGILVLPPLSWYCFLVLVTTTVSFIFLRWTGNLLLLAQDGFVSNCMDEINLWVTLLRMCFKCRTLLGHKNFPMSFLSHVFCGPFCFFFPKLNQCGTQSIIAE